MAGPDPRLGRMSEQSRKLAALERVRLGAASRNRSACSRACEQAERTHREAQERSDQQHAKGSARLRNLYDELPGRLLPPSSLTRLRDEETVWRTSHKALAAVTEKAVAELQAAERALTAAAAELAGILRRSRRREALAQRLGEDDRRAREMEDELRSQDALPS